MEYIAYIHTPFPEKFGIPRQSGLVPDALGEIVFEPQFRNPDAVKGIEEFSHLWLLWDFSGAKQKEFHATVAPPRLGGKERRGVFATRSPFRPNSIGLSCVKLEQVRLDEKLGPVLTVSGVDMLDGTPLYDIKPYLPYADAHPEAVNGFAEAYKDNRIKVDFSQELLEKLPEELRQTVTEVLAQDPRAAYNKKPDYVYGMAFADYDIRFVVADGQITVKDVKRRDGKWKRVK
ncbi:MAG: tRNA (N6-threonylcarbamoyladenosine(37)-N6)-methyltransferase TrmO [Lachnospiraceae bacterium]|nr:tRNA (N6-threonylcarbamoyladenosine(37)-N6)-methyltransferase TrmO [Lachnospiraceae bacterium]